MVEMKHDEGEKDIQYAVGAEGEKKGAKKKGFYMQMIGPQKPRRWLDIYEIDAVRSALFPDREDKSLSTGRIACVYVLFTLVPASLRAQIFYAHLFYDQIPFWKSSRDRNRILFALTMRL
jgi:hypothetical protein